MHAVRLLSQVDWQAESAADDNDILEFAADDTPDPASPEPFALSPDVAASGPTKHTSQTDTLQQASAGHHSGSGSSQYTPATDTPQHALASGAIQQADRQPAVSDGRQSLDAAQQQASTRQGSDLWAKAVPMGEVVSVLGRSNQDIVVSMAEEDQKAMQQRQQTSRSVSLWC